MYWKYWNTLPLRRNAQILELGLKSTARGNNGTGPYSETPFYNEDASAVITAIKSFFVRSLFGTSLAAHFHIYLYLSLSLPLSLSLFFSRQSVVMCQVFRPPDARWVDPEQIEARVGGTALGLRVSSPSPPSPPAHLFLWIKPLSSTARYYLHQRLITNNQRGIWTLSFTGALMNYILDYFNLLSFLTFF